MKYILLLCDGMADEPVQSLGNKTPMEAAYKPNMDMLAPFSEIGKVQTVPERMQPGSDVANLSVLGYDPSVCYSGRSPLEAVSIGINLNDTDVTLRCNLVTLSEEEENYEDKTLVDYCADDISTEEAKILIEFIQDRLGGNGFNFYSGKAYRHCLVWTNGAKHPGILTPPHDITGKKIKDYIPKGDFTEGLYSLMKKSCDLLKTHPVNLERVKKGKRPANSVWLWGEGTKPKLDSFYNKFKKKGSMISAVDLLKGIAICAGMRSIDVPGATGYIDTNFEGKVAAAVSELINGQDFVYIHVEAPDECGHRGEVQNKVKSIELIDEKILSPLLDRLKDIDDYKILICPDHPTPLNIRTHTKDPVPYLIYNSRNAVQSGINTFTEMTAEKSGMFISPGYFLLSHFLSD